MEKCLEKNLDLELTKLELKFEAWKVANWVTGKGTKIKNWRSTLLNTLPYLQKEKSSAKKEKVTSHEARIGRQTYNIISKKQNIS